MTMNPDELCCCGHTHEVHFSLGCSRQGCSCEQFCWIDAGAELLSAVETALKFFYNPTSFKLLSVEKQYQAAIRKAKGL
jgi:hypothetical protein